ncbi:MAG: hypothetical protein EGQ92_07060 [Lactobacillus ruminis]|nr:hypothetical protein [Ligilactobacillus ruminis]
MQCLINQHAELSVKFIAKLFLVISVTKGDCHAYAKKPDDLQSIANLIRFFNLRHNFSRPQGIRIQKIELQSKKVFGKIPKTINYLSSIITNLQQHQLPLK